MKVFILMGNIEQESDDILGVYSSKELADEALIKWKSNRDKLQFDSYSIEEHTIDQL